MITKKELIDFAEFCKIKYQMELNEVIIEDFIRAKNSKEESELYGLSSKRHPNIGCSSDGIHCSHLDLNSAQCYECPY